MFEQIPSREKKSRKTLAALVAALVGGAGIFHLLKDDTETQPTRVEKDSDSPVSESASPDAHSERPENVEDLAKQLENIPYDLPRIENIPSNNPIEQFQIDNILHKKLPEKDDISPDEINALNKELADSDVLIQADPKLFEIKRALDREFPNHYLIKQNLKSKIFPDWTTRLDFHFSRDVHNIPRSVPHNLRLSLANSVSFVELDGGGLKIYIRGFGDDGFFEARLLYDPEQVVVELDAYLKLRVLFIAWNDSSRGVSFHDYLMRTGNGALIEHVKAEYLQKVIDFDGTSIE